MLGQGENSTDHLGGGGGRKSYLRSVSWTDRSPTRPSANAVANSRTNQASSGSKARSCLPPLQPLAIDRRPVEEWPKAGSDDLGVWPNVLTPRGPAKQLVESSSVERPVREFQFKKDKLAFFDKECSRIADHIYLGSENVAKNREVLRQNGITHVLNCVGFVCPEYFKGDVVYKTLWLQDSPSEDITSILYDVFDYFEDVREHGGKVFVHCCQGVSRSTSLVIAYLMWREGQSFEEAFQYVKAARGVTNPNMGFACQLLLCQKRVHAVPVSPNSVLRMYRMAPHSSYDPLHLVPKMLSQPSVRGLDSRGAFIVHVPATIFVWIGRNCSPAMSNQVSIAANQVIRYERAQGPFVSVREGEEPPEFWDALASGKLSQDNSNREETGKHGPPSCDGIGERKVEEYNLDFELFRRALAGGVVPAISVSTPGSETCLPARENGWGRLRQKFASGIMKEFFASSKVNHDVVPSTDESEMSIDTIKESQLPVSPGSADYSPHASTDTTMNDCEEKEENSAPLTKYLSPPQSPCGSPDSFACNQNSSPKFNYKSPTLSPSTSDYSSSSFTFSPSSSNWSDLSYLSSRQPSPSGLGAADPLPVENTPVIDTFCVPFKEAPPSPGEVFCVNFEKSCKGSSPSLAERRGSNPPPRMLVRSWSFSLPELDDEEMTENCQEQFKHEISGEEPTLDVDTSSRGDGPQSEEKQGEFPFSLG